LKKFLEQMKFSCRDNGRTPFQWDASNYAGFSSTEPWIKVNPNYTAINAAAQEKEPQSPLNYFRKVVALRKGNPIYVYGKYTLLDKANPNVYAYTRELAGKKVVVILNFTAKNTEVNIGINLAGKKCVLGNYASIELVQNAEKNTVALRPYEAVIYEL